MFVGFASAECCDRTSKILSPMPLNFRPRTLLKSLYSCRRNYFDLEGVTKFANFARDNKTFFEDEIEKQEKQTSLFKQQTLKMVAMTLPDTIPWPTLEEYKHDSELTHVYFHRYGGADTARYEATLDVLRGKSSLPYVSWIGVPESGKCKFSCLVFSCLSFLFNCLFDCL